MGPLSSIYEEIQASSCWQLLFSSFVTFSAKFNLKSFILGHLLGTGSVAK